MKRILVIAGSDSSGGAGLEADQKVIAAHACYAMTATTALTAQNTLGVQAIHEIPPEFVQKQMRACVEDIGVDVVKTGPLSLGMLASSLTVSAVARTLRDLDIRTLIVDPVMVSTSGAELLPRSAVAVLVKEILPIAYLLTPNIPEANLLLQEAGESEINVAGVADLKRLAKAIQMLGPRYVLLKGGHEPLRADYSVPQGDEMKELVVNVLQGENICEIVDLPYQSSRNTHGTGCSLASSIACHIANGSTVSEAVHRGCHYVEAGIKTGSGLGKGVGPLNHFHSMLILPFSPGRFVDYVLERTDVKEVWRDYTNHEFVERMGDGTLAPELFKSYMIQDYLYLVQFARANALAAYKAKNIDEIGDSATMVLHIRNEMSLHVKECQAFGLTEQNLQDSDESQACTAYSRYVLDIGQSEDWFALQIGLLPCLLGYGMIAQRLKSLQTLRYAKEPNRYITWINNYTAEDYNDTIRRGRALVEKHAIQQSPHRIEELIRIFVQATKMETGFWDMGLQNRL